MTTSRFHSRNSDVRTEYNNLMNALKEKYEPKHVHSTGKLSFRKGKATLPQTSKSLSIHPLYMSLKGMADQNSLNYNKIH